MNLDGFDASQVEPTQEFTPIPDGEYPVICTDSELKPTKAGTGSYLQLVWEVIEGEHKGRKLWSRITMTNPNQTAVEIGQRELSAVCHALGVLRPKDSAEFHGKPVLVKVIVKRYDGGLSNEVKGYKAMGSAPAPAPAPQAPTASTAGGPPANPPWKRSA